MSYEIRIIGEKEPLIVESNIIGDAIKDKYLKFKAKIIPDEALMVSGWIGTLSRISTLRLTQTSRSASKVFDETEKSSNEGRKGYLDLPVSERAKKLGFFRLVFWNFTGKRSEDIDGIEAEAIKIQHKFFEENPSRAYCDPTLFRSIIPGNKGNVTGTALIERIVTSDYQFSK